MNSEGLDKLIDKNEEETAACMQASWILMLSYLLQRSLLDGNGGGLTQWWL